MMGAPISKTRQYKILAGMKQRCYNPRNQHYNRYGGRGITVCDEWLGKDGARNFYEWSIAHGYADNLSIDRIDNNLGYCPSNCVWVPNEWNTSRSDLAFKLELIIHYVPTYEASFIRTQIKKVDDHDVRKYLRKELSAVQKIKEKRHRISLDSE